MVKILAPLSLLAIEALADNPCGGGTSECDDAPGDFGECCIDQATICVAPRGGFTVSGCCPRWTVGCEVGTVGCCDPARPWQAVTIPGVKADRKMMSELPQVFEDVAAEAQAGTLAFALFTESFKLGLSALTIDASTGRVLSRRDVSGPAGSWYQSYMGAQTRILPWDQKSARFIFVDSDLSSGAMTLYSIDPSTGQSISQSVSGCTGNPVGMAWDADLQALVVSTQTDAEASFFAVNPASGEARPLGRVQRGADESGESYYAAYMSHIHSGVAFRSGLKMVYAGDYEGFGVTTLPGTSDEGSSVWQEPTKADEHGLPDSMQRHPAGGFLSLAARESGHLDIIAWSANGTSQVLAELANAQYPQTPGTGPLGYVADAPVVGNIYATMTVAIANGTMGIGDKWTLSTLSLNGGEVSEFALTPQPSVIGAETVSLSGFGLTAQKMQSVSV